MYRTNHLFEGERDRLGASGRLLPVTGSDGAAAPYPLTDRPAIVRDRSSAAPGPSRGTFLKEIIVLRDAPGEVLVAAVMGEFSRLRQLRRKRHAREIEHEQRLLSCVLANGLRCHWYRTTPLVSFQRKADVDFYTKRNRPAWLSAQALGRAIEGLVDAGLAQLQVGYRGTSSAYALNGRLLRLAEVCGVSERSLGISLHREDLIRLKGRRPKTTFDPFAGKLTRHDAERIYFEPTPQTEHWRDGLAAYNEFVAAQDIALEPTEDAIVAWVTKLNNDDLGTGATFRRPELFWTPLYRVFNDASAEDPEFDKGGRLAGGWWMNAPGEVRALISINREPTVELDYSACHPRMLYHELGREPPTDPYHIPEVAALEREDGREPGGYRDLVKWQTQVLINGGSRPDLVAVPSDIERPPNAALSDIRRFIRQQHEPISSAFRSKAGLRLMNAEAAIAFAVISRARGNGWLALPVHDAFIVPTSREEELRTMMIEEYKSRFGYQPRISKKGEAASPRLTI